MLEYSMFERLPFRSQAELIAKDGVVLAQRKYNGWTVTLYTLNGSFVELWAGEQVQMFGTFKRTANTLAILEPYADGVDLQEVLDL
ncbi:hypothetical protein [Pontibacter mangrovi]|uniref:Uncharacterized protein n=1 Tax=Pontibacter mangrovi TaxID=2589816 RepID=A0A501W9Q9_9BACT|nr:hypothetical protein [Pontibacter mangrovi]TPE46339.1 hypothetical protein FJM65_03080 [Pontibacter mangrovi]